LPTPTSPTTPLRCGPTRNDPSNGSTSGTGQVSASGYTSCMTCHAFVLGGGGVLGVAEVGMARALLEARVRPDWVCSTSVGAIHGAAIAADPTPEGAQRLLDMWDALGENGIVGG